MKALDLVLTALLTLFIFEQSMKAVKKSQDVSNKSIRTLVGVYVLIYASFYVFSSYEFTTQSHVLFTIIYLIYLYVTYLYNKNSDFDRSEILLMLVVFVNILPTIAVCLFAKVFHLT